MRYNQGSAMDRNFHQIKFRDFFCILARHRLSSSQAIVTPLGNLLEPVLIC
jgi:hypothetical protein